MDEKYALKLALDNIRAQVRWAKALADYQETPGTGRYTRKELAGVMRRFAEQQQQFADYIDQQALQ